MRAVLLALALAGCRSEVDLRELAKVCDGVPLSSAPAFDPAEARTPYPVAVARRAPPSDRFGFVTDFDPAPLAAAGVVPASKANGADAALVVCVDHLSQAVVRECRMGGGTVDRQVDETVTLSLRETRTARVLATRTATLSAPAECPRWAAMMPGQTSVDDLPPVGAKTPNVRILCDFLASYLPVPLQKKL